MTHLIETPNAIPQTHRKQFSPADFKGMFTPSEYRAISVLTQSDDTAFQLWDIVQSAAYINVKDTRVINGLTYLASVGAITDTRKNELLLGIPL